MIALFAALAFGQAHLDSGTGTWAAEDVEATGSDEDHNDVVLRFRRQCTVDAGGQLVAEVVHLTGLAAGASLTNALVLTLPAAPTSVRACADAADCDAGGTPLSADAFHRVTLVDDMRDLFAAPTEGFVNTEPPPIVGGRQLRVEVTYTASGVALGAGPCPPPAFAVVRPGVFIDASTTIGANDRPLVGTFTGDWSVPTEHTPITGAYSQFLCWVTGSGCATWYATPTPGLVVDRTGTLPPLDAFETCDDLVQNGGEAGVDCDDPYGVCGACGSQVTGWLSSRTTATCATVAGQVKCWGTGPTGVSIYTAVHAPNTVSTLTGIDRMSTGVSAACAVVGGGVRCWGENGWGVLGPRPPTESNTPLQIAGLTGIEQVANGDHHACSLDSAGGVKCWGQNSFGQLGIGSNDINNHTAPLQVTGLTSGVEQLVAGTYHNCVLKAGGGVACWGSDGSGQLGDGAGTGQCGTGSGTECRKVPNDVPGITGATAIMVGPANTCALFDGAPPKCWGANNRGQLGGGFYSSGYEQSPVTATALPANVVQIALGQEHACALTLSGDVWCYGGRDNGRLGDGFSSGATFTPFHVALPSPATDVSAGDAFSCARLATGEIRCWGADNAGQIGNGVDATGNKLVPTLVSGIP